MEQVIVEEGGYESFVTTDFIYVRREGVAEECTCKMLTLREFSIARCMTIPENTSIHPTSKFQNCRLLSFQHPYPDTLINCKLDGFGEIISVSRMTRFGSRGDSTLAVFTENGALIQCGCFRGRLGVFEQRVRSFHHDSQYLDEYLGMIVMLKAKAKRLEIEA